MRCLQNRLSIFGAHGPQQNHVILQLLDNDVVLRRMKCQHATWMTTERKGAVCSDQVKDSCNK